jgi:hypothetical protein
MKYSLLFSVFLLSTIVGFAQDNYDASLIPSSLLSRVNATIRNEETIVDMQSPNEVNLTVNKAITILNKNGDENSRLVLFYDKNTIIKSVKGEVYNEFGKLTGKFSQGDFRDESAVQGFSLFEDSRVKHYLPAINAYPYTIVYHYEIRFKQNLIIPDWIPKSANDISVEKSSYTFVCKPADQFRIKAQNYNGMPLETVDNKQKTLIWKISNLAGLKAEPYSPIKETYLTSIKIAPQQFNYFNYKGNYTNWDELGKWSYDNLLKGRNSISPTTAQVIKDLVKNESNDKEKARKIYQYLQDKTRYISVQIGIGGFQPVTAAEVDRLGYGDCKALVNYMQSLLNVVGIESYYCVVEAGSEKVSLDPTYASMNQGNHIILCLPLKGDTTWLECTSQTIPFGFLGDFTDDRYVLACTENGGKLLRTPKLATQQNLQVRNALLTLDKDGNINGTLKTVFTGAQYDNNERIAGKPLNEQQRLLKETYDIDNINFDQINYVQKKNEHPELTEKLTVNIRNYGSINNDRLFLLVNAFNTQRNIPEVRNRIMPVYINRGFKDLDTIIYKLPDNILPLTELKDKHFSNQFGEYESKIKFIDQQLIYTRKLIINEGTFPAESYDTFFQFITEVNSSDHFKVVFSLKK